MQPFDQLGAEVENLWREKNYNEDDFPALAADALKRAALPERLSAWDILDWSLKQTELPRQRDVAGNFGDPPITVYSAPRFYIDVYFWFEGTTATHQHGFCGAFQVLAGSSIHSWYEFERREAINAFCEIGDIRLKVCELLEVGDVQEILAGRQYIHSLFHLDHPSVSIVVRTERSPLHLPQFSYHKPYLAIDPFYDEPTLLKKTQVLSAMFRGARRDTDEQVVELLRRSDLQSSYSILSQVRGFLRSNQLSEMFTPDAAQTRFNAFLDGVADTHGAAGEALRPVFEYQDRIDEIVKRRGYVTNPEHRFFMALLLNVEGRDRIFSLIKKRYPDSDPIEKVLDWTFDLSQTRVMGADNTNALGIANFGDVEMFALEKLLHGKTDDEIAEAFKSEHPDASPEMLTPAIEKIRESVLFGPLLSD
jgi:hypothetical protein